MTDYYKDVEYTYTPREKYTCRFTATDVHALREERGIGLMEAKSILMKEQILKDIQSGRNSLNVSLLYDILEYMIEGKPYV